MVNERQSIEELQDLAKNEPDKALIAIKKIIKEYHALFGVPNWGDYVTILQLTETSRGGLEHLNSQTSMLPRVCLIDGFVDEY